jgi:hypothetical protein
VFVIGLLQLVLDHHLLVAIGAEDVELEVAHPVLGGHCFQLAQAECLRQRIEVGSLGQPGREVARLVLPGFAQRHAF